ncbi:MAG: 16S rRNA (uracil(1498)-N(3))-methyltransferase [Bacillota bacterium]
MYRFFINEEDIEGDMVKITGKDFNHISNSLRLQPGDKIIVTRGKGREYLVKLREFEKGLVRGEVIEQRPDRQEPTARITLAQAIPKKRNMELVVEKTTELGVYSIIPLETERTVVKLSGNKADKRKNRWQRIAEAAAKQSQRGFIPRIESICRPRQFAKRKEDYDLILVFSTAQGVQSLQDVEYSPGIRIGNILLFVGPEGGFNKEEVYYLKHELGAIPVTLGPRILRTETAGIVGTALLLYEIGNMGVD